MCGPDEFCGPDGSDACPNHDSYFAVAAMPHLIADLRAKNTEVERLQAAVERLRSELSDLRLKS